MRLNNSATQFLALPALPILKTLQFETILPMIAPISPVVGIAILFQTTTSPTTILQFTDSSQSFAARKFLWIPIPRLHGSVHGNQPVLLGLIEMSSTFSICCSTHEVITPANNSSIVEILNWSMFGFPLISLGMNLQTKDFQLPNLTNSDK